MNNEKELRQLLRDMENEAIDKTQWIHQSFVKAYAFATDRIGAQERGRMVVCSTQFAFDELYRTPKKEPVLNGSHLSAAEFFVTLRQVALFKSDYTRLRELLIDTYGTVEGIPGSCPMTLYMHIMRPLATVPRHRAMVERICLHPLRTNDWGWILQCRESIREGFDKLAESIEFALDTMKKKTENTGMNRGEVSLKFTQPA